MAAVRAVAAACSAASRAAAARAAASVLRAEFGTGARRGGGPGKRGGVDFTGSSAGGLRLTGKAGGVFAEPRDV